MLTGSDNYARRIKGIISEVSGAGVKVEFAGRMGSLHVPLRLVISNGPVVAGQSVELSMSYVQVVEDPDPAWGKGVSFVELTFVKGLQSEIYVPDVPAPIWAEPQKPLQESVVALVTAAGVHLREQRPFKLAGDFTFREIPGNVRTEQLMVTHGGYDNGDVNKDLNCMFPIERLWELYSEGVVGGVSPVMIGFMGGGGNQEKFREETGPQIAAVLKEKGVDAVVLTAG